MALRGGSAKGIRVATMHTLDRVAFSCGKHPDKVFSRSERFHRGKAFGGKIIQRGKIVLVGGAFGHFKGALDDK